MNIKQKLQDGTISCVALTIEEYTRLKRTEEFAIRLLNQPHGVSGPYSTRYTRNLCEALSGLPVQCAKPEPDYLSTVGGRTDPICKVCGSPLSAHDGVSGRECPRFDEDYYNYFNDLTPEAFPRAGEPRSEWANQNRDTWLLQHNSNDVFGEGNE